MMKIGSEQYYEAHQHQITKCMHGPEHRNAAEAAGGSVSAEVPEPPVSIQEAGQAQGIPAFLRRLAAGRTRHGTGPGTAGEKDGIHPAEGSESLWDRTAVSGDAAGRTGQTPDPAVNRGILSVLSVSRLAVLTEPVRRICQKTAAWGAKRVRRISELSAGLYSRYFKGRDSGKQSGYGRRKAEDRIFDRSGREEKEERQSRTGLPQEQDFLLDSYNRSGEYTKLMK